VYLRARYYSTASGRFMSRDNWAGDKGIPMSYNAWLYGYGNPVIYTDPSGLCSVRDEDCLQVSRTLKISYGWEIIGTWQESEVKLFLESAKLISSFFDKTGGNGAGRMRAFAPVYLEHANNFWTTGGYHHVFMRRIILTPIVSIGNVTHEFSHIIDNVLGISLFSSISGGGPSDEFAKHLGVDLSACPKRFACANYKKLLEDVGAEKPYDEYALNGPSEDFAVTFEQLVLGNSSFKNENPIRAAWMMQFIESNKQSRDLIFEPAPAPEPANDIASICDSDEYMKTPTP